MFYTSFEMVLLVQVHIHVLVIAMHAVPGATES